MAIAGGMQNFSPRDRRPGALSRHSLQGGGGRVPQRASDLGEYLLIVEMSAGDDPGRAGGHAGAAALAQRGDHPADAFLLVEFDGVKGTKVVADPAAGAALLVDRGHDRLDG